MLTKVCKNILVGCIYIGIGVIVSWAILTSMAQEQERKEAALEHKINTSKVGSFVRLNGHGFLKTSQAISK